MKRQISDRPGAGCSVVWQLQNGRSRIQRGMAADGFRGDFPYAGVTVVAENKDPEENTSASIIVETVRDVFAEGVAFGVEDVLRDAFQEAAEIIRDKKLSGCSAAAIAVCGTHIWYAMAGNCRIYRIDSDGVNCFVHDQSAATEINMPPDHTDYYKKIREMKWWLGSPSQGKPVCGHARIKQDTTYMILTAGGWTQFENTANTFHRKGTRKTLDGWLASVTREMKLAYRRQGGALGAVSGLKKKRRNPFSWRTSVCITAFLGLMAFLVFANPFSRSSETSDSERTDLFSSDSSREDIVQPIAGDTTPETASHEEFWLLSLVSDSLFFSENDSAEAAVLDISADLPLQVVQVGGSVPSLSRDTFAISLNSEPDPQWENFAPGIYAIRADTVSLLLARTISISYPGLEVRELDRIITVRENGVVESARWLSNLSPDSASSTGVIVETRSSVAGGANWIRNYPVFANGNRDDRAGEAGGFMGDSLPGLPSLRNPHCYRLIVII